MKTIIEMVREAGIDEWWDSGAEWRETFDSHLEHFAELVRADEREACAKVCDARVMGDNNREDMEAKRCAADIRSFRARGQV